MEQPAGARRPVLLVASCFAALRLRFYNSDARCVVSLKVRATLSNGVNRVEEDKEDIDPALGRACVTEPWHLPAVTTSRIDGQVREEFGVGDNEGSLVCLGGGWN